MDEHDLMEVLKALVERSSTDLYTPELLGNETFRTPGEGASFGVAHEDVRFIVTITQIGD